MTSLFCCYIGVLEEQYLDKLHLADMVLCLFYIRCNLLHVAYNNVIQRYPSLHGHAVASERCAMISFRARRERTADLIPDLIRGTECQFD